MERTLIMSRSRDDIALGQLRSSSAAETCNYVHQLSARLRGGEILLLSGPLGAGNTIVVKGIAPALGIDEEDVTSPSSTLVTPHFGRLRLYHIDHYRLD